MIYKTNDLKDFQKIINMQQNFVAENCCNGICLDNISVLSKKCVFIVKEDEKIVGYAYGDFEIAKKNKTYIKKGDKSFNLEEVYIEPKYRNKGYGREICVFVENFAKENKCKNIQVVAVSKNYEKLLKFYIKQLGFDFWSAWLIKQI